MELYPFQYQGIRFMSEHPNVLNADEMGLGKSVQAIKASAGGSVLVICPAFLKLNWQREFMMWTNNHPDHVGLVQGGEWPLLHHNVVVINYDILHRHYEALRARTWGTIICDEAHYMQSTSARRTKHIIGYQAWDAIDGLRRIPTKRRIALSGTPCDKPWSLWPILCWLDPARWLKMGFSKFEMRYCPKVPSQFGMIRRPQNLGELGDILRATLMIRRTKNEVLTELPDKTRETLALPVSYSGPEPKNKAEFAKTRKDLGLCKVDAAAAYINMCVESGDNPVVFAYHREVLAALGQKIGVEPITGSTRMDIRQFKVDAFQAGMNKVFLGQVEACGTGLNLTAGRHVIFAELDWRPLIMKQAEDRTHRIGQKNAVLVTHLVVPNSIDERVSRALIRKQANINAIFGEDESLIGEVLGFDE